MNFCIQQTYLSICENTFSQMILLQSQNHTDYLHMVSVFIFTCNEYLSYPTYNLCGASNVSSKCNITLIPSLHYLCKVLLIFLLP